MKKFFIVVILSFFFVSFVYADESVSEKIKKFCEYNTKDFPPAYLGCMYEQGKSVKRLAYVHKMIGDRPELKKIGEFCTDFATVVVSDKEVYTDHETLARCVDTRIIMDWAE